MAASLIARARRSGCRGRAGSVRVAGRDCPPGRARDGDRSRSSDIRRSRNDQDHVCTGNSFYRAAALHQVGLFDEALGYGYDNDMSYRLIARRLSTGVLSRRAQPIIDWRDSLGGYVAQQYGFGYGRLDVVAKHPRRIVGDAVSPAGMMAHGVVMTLAILLVLGALGLNVAGQPPLVVLAIASGLIGALAIERLWAATRAMRHFGDPAAVLFVPLHLLRDLAWAAAISVWSFRRALGAPPQPAYSMGRALDGAPAMRAPIDVHSPAMSRRYACWA